LTLFIFTHNFHCFGNKSYLLLTFQFAFILWSWWSFVDTKSGHSL
jgi:hypothetical protein